MNQKLRETKENRLLGASFVLARETQSGLQVLLMQDTAKTEVSAGFSRWLTASNPAWSFPGGGRSITADGNLETRQQTLQSEIQEEMNLILALSFLDKGKVQQVPFLVGQKKQNLIHQIGVTSALYWFDELETEEQNFIQIAEKQNVVWWNELKKIVVGYNISLAIQDRIKEIKFRPHLYTTALLWYMDLVQKIDFEQIMDRINGLNRITRRFLLSESERLQIPIQNGAFNNLGNVLLSNELNDDDAKFLYDIEKLEGTAK